MEKLNLNQAEASSQQSIGKSPPSNARKALILRCQKILFAAYRIDQYADPEGFMVSLGAVLEQFPDEVIVYITDPRTGIQRRSKWPPTISEVIECGEDHQAHLERLRTRRPLSRQLPAPLIDRAPGHFARIFVPEGHAKYQKLVDWTAVADETDWKFGKSSDGRNGLWVSYDAWDGNFKKGQ